ncbi:MAG: hypothetical protein DRJ39_02410 [Thermoprotei archaeon]|nr:MAG: hypothetical protein DRJ39_02410 [Thermoprotei archaeon]
MSGEYLEIGRVTRFHLKLLIMLMLGWSFDSMNSGLVSFLLKQIVREWGLSPEIAGFMLSSWLVGMLVGAFVMGLDHFVFQSRSLGVTYAYTPELYPTEIKGTGSGLANSVGRIGGILGPITVGFIASLTGSYFYVFTIFALAHFVSAITVLLLGIETAGKVLEEI